MSLVNAFQSYDIIGDVHGHADELTDLLRSMGYNEKNEVFRHPSRKVIFLGDFIDRGPKQLETLKVVMNMVDAGEALAVMGNHEFNALSYHTQHPQTRTWLRDHSEKNYGQHEAFLTAFEKNTTIDSSLQDVLSFFWRLPLWLDLPGLRIIHACWDRESMETIRPYLNSDNTLSLLGLVLANDIHSVQFESVERLLKGVEFSLPNESFFTDSYGISRSNVRLKWWCNSTTRLEEVALTLNKHQLPQSTLDHVVPSEALIGYSPANPPLFFGHYWLDESPQRLAPNVACLDYSVAKQGKLVAYRWDGEMIIDNEKFHIN